MFLNYDVPLSYFLCLICLHGLQVEFRFLPLKSQYVTSIVRIKSPSEVILHSFRESWESGI